MTCATRTDELSARSLSVGGEPAAGFQQLLTSDAKQPARNRMATAGVETFNVLKVNKKGKTQSRVLELNFTDGIISVRACRPEMMPSACRILTFCMNWRA